MTTLLLLCAAWAAGADAPYGLVNIKKVDASIALDIRYATPNNFTGKKVYPFAACFLQADAARMLRAAQQELKARGLGLKVYDCYRPLGIQRKFWALVPDERYVADPRKGSRHNKGLAVDLTVVDADGRELTMPTDYDDFSAKAHRNAPTSVEAARNRALLEQIMTTNGFAGLPTEWWHFDAPGWDKAPLLDVSFEELLLGPAKHRR